MPNKVKLTLNASRAKELLTLIDQMDLVDTLKTDLFEQWKVSESIQLDGAIRVQLALIDNTVTVLRRLAAT